MQTTDSCAALQNLHDEHSVVCQEAAGRTLGDIALGPAGKNGGTDDARHAKQQGVVFLERRGVVGTWMRREVSSGETISVVEVQGRQ